MDSKTGKGKGRKIKKNSIGFPKEVPNPRGRKCEIEKSPNLQLIDQILLKKKAPNDRSVKWVDLIDEIKEKFNETYTIKMLKHRREKLFALELLQKDSAVRLEFNRMKYSASRLGILNRLIEMGMENAEILHKMGQNIQMPMEQTRSWTYFIMNAVKAEKELADSLGLTVNHSAPKSNVGSSSDSSSLNEVLADRVKEAQELESDKHYREMVERKMKLQKERLRIKKETSSNGDSEVYDGMLIR